MENSYFSAEMIRMLVECGGRSVVSSLFPPETSPVRNPAHERWMTGHQDRHQHREILIPFSGKSVYGFLGKAYPCNPGTLFLFDSNEAHDDNYPPFAPPGVHLWLGFLGGKPTGRVLESGGGKLVSRRVFVIDDSASAILIDQVWTRAAETRGKAEPYRRARIVSALSSVLMAAVEEGEGAGISKKRPSSQHCLREIIKSIMLSIAATGGRDMNLDRLARYSGYSKFHFLRAFRSYSGKSVHEFIDECRMKKVREMLRSGHNRSEISETLGFSSLTVFCRWFRNASDRKGRGR